MSELIISVSGLRGIVGEALTPEVVIRYVAAFAAQLPPGPVVVTRDGRYTGPTLVAAVHSALLAVGRDCLDADVAATPTTGVLVRHLEAAGGIQISASHNPPEYNGLKLFTADGRVIPAGPGQRVKEQFETTAPAWSPFDALGKAEKVADTVAAHAELVLATCDVDRIRSRRFKVLLDANHGSGAVLALPLLEKLGCEVLLLGATPDGHFEHPPEPTAENLGTVLNEVTVNGVDVGFCQDPDADRLALIDENGRYVGEEFTLAIVAKHMLAHTPGPVVTNCSTSRMTQDVAEDFGVPFFRSKVGEANVVDLMLAEKAVLGGEGNGGVIDPRVGLVRDSFAGMALVLDAMARREKPLSKLADELPQYAIEKTKVTLPADRVAASFDALEKRFSDAAPDRLDGLRLDWPDRWLLVRASNTEPIVRIFAEAPTKEAAAELCAAAGEVVA